MSDKDVKLHFDKQNCGFCGCKLDSSNSKKTVGLGRIKKHEHTQLMEEVEIIGPNLITKIDLRVCGGRKRTSDSPTHIEAGTIMRALSLLCPSMSEEYSGYLIEKRAEWAGHYGWMREKVLTYSTLTQWLLMESIHLITAPVRAVWVRLSGL